MRESLGKDVMLSADIFAGWWTGEQYLTEIQDHVDYINLMAFDFTGGWETSKKMHHSDFRAFKKAIKYALKRNFKKEKVLVGLPSYGIEFIDGQKKNVRHVPYAEIVALTEANGKALKSGKIGNTFFETIENIRKRPGTLIRWDWPVFPFLKSHPMLLMIS